MVEPPVEQPGTHLVNLPELLEFSDHGPQARLLFDSQEARLVGFALRAGQEKWRVNAGQLAAMGSTPRCPGVASTRQLGMAGNSGTSSSATILMILISGLTAGPAVSL